MTEWKRHPTFTKYLVSDTGLVRHEDAKSFRKVRLDRNGYLRLNIPVAGQAKAVHVHKMVAEAFIGSVVAPMSVNHIDGDKKNNRLSNLEIISMGENTSHSFRSGQRVNCRCKPTVFRGVSYVSIRSAAKHTGIPYQHIRLGKVA